MKKARLFLDGVQDYWTKKHGPQKLHVCLRVNQKRLVSTAQVDEALD